MTALEFVNDDGTTTTLEPDEPPLSVTETARDDLACMVCGKPLVYAGRGRKPTRCDEHKTSRSSGSSSRSSGTKDERMRQELSQTLGMIGLAVMAADAYDGLVIIDRTPQTVNALMEVAAHNPRVRKILEQMLEVSVWAALGTAVAGIVVPIGVHHGVIPLPVEAVEAQFISESTRESLAKLPKREPRKRPARPAPQPSQNPQDDSPVVGLRSI